MLHIKSLTIITLSLLIGSCEGDKNEKNNLFSIDTSVLKQVYQPNESADFVIKNEKAKKIDSVNYILNNKPIGTSVANNKLHYSFENEKLGWHLIKAKVYFENETAEIETNFTVVAQDAPKLLTYKIINTYPHDIAAYTQGFEFYRDTLIEGTGNGAGSGTGKRGISSLRKTNYKTGEVYKKVELGMQYFGEGITILNNKVYQLTYKNNEGYVYNADTFEKTKTFKYFKNMEGWGLTNDGKNLYMSNGTEKIYILDPETLEEIDYINIYTNANKIEAVNELEWIDGKIWANVYGRDAIAIINPKSGAVESIINLSDLKSKVTKHPDLDVLNGIAYNPKTKTVFVTGKNWDKVFEITVE